MRTKNQVAIVLATALVLTMTLAISSVAAGGRTFSLALSSAEEVPTPSDDATGTAWLQINPGQREVCFEITWDDVSGIVVAAHIHVAPVGVAGPIVVPLFMSPQVSDDDGDGSTAACVSSDLSSSQLAHILAKPSGYYVNVHSTVNPAGAIRAQLG